ncbi:plakophilin-3 isoform X2 [Gouania willdenowi]|uniref:plakophilin-3 isoform X2 n=1 Tax=Gouania willdenowi TaxID=441366 RepID=UPI001055A0A8|nr:plakophilin-3 isoform X2 [Gouania willdenowi]
MSTATSDSAFFSAIQPNTSVTTYALPSDGQIGHVRSGTDEVSKARRVQQQIQLRLAEKSTLPRQNGSNSQYAMSDYGGSSTMKYQTYTPSYSSKSSYAYSSGAKTMGPRVAQRSGFSCHSTGPDMAHFQRMSIGGGNGGGVGVVSGGGGGGGYYHEEMRMGGYQGSMRPRLESERVTLSSLRQQSMNVNPWMVDGSDGGSLVSDRDATYGRQYAHSTTNGYSGQMRQGGGFVGGGTLSGSMHRSLSGTLSRGGGGAMMGGGAAVMQQHSFKGPAQRTISRITNRTNRMSMGSMSGTMQQQMSSGGSTYGGMEGVDGGFLVGNLPSASQGNLMMQRQGNMSRAMSLKSVHSVGRGMDVGVSMGNLSGIDSQDIPTAVGNLREPDPELQVLGAAYIQHRCYSDKESKDEVRHLNGIGELVKLFNSSNQEVRRYVTGATRNLIYENMENKNALIEEGGITELVRALNESDDELCKNITGILWNLSSKDNLKEKLANETLNELTEKILIPLSSGESEYSEKINDGDARGAQQSASEAEIFCNTTGCLRNLSSASLRTRQMMRGTPGLVDSLVNYVRASIENNKTEDKGVENTVCVLRNLSYQLYNEIPPSASLRLEGPTRDQGSGNNEAIGCFAPHSRKAKKKRNTSQHTLSEVARIPKGMEWLWHPKIVAIYNRVLQTCEINSTTREAAAGALQNITAGDTRWASVLASHALEQERVLPVVLDLLRTDRDSELRSLTGFLRNLSRHTSNKDDMATKTVSNLLTKLPENGYQNKPSSEVVVNICGILNNLVSSSSLAARDIAFFDGLGKLMGIKNSHDNSSGKEKAAKAAATVLANMFNYKKLHKQYHEKGFPKSEFTNI